MTMTIRWLLTRMVGCSDDDGADPYADDHKETPTD
jgi:hypothetical protein